MITLSIIGRQFLYLLSSKQVNKRKDKNSNRILYAVFTINDSDLLLSLDEFTERILSPIVTKFYNIITYTRKRKPKYIPEFEALPMEDASIITYKDYHIKISKIFNVEKNTCSYQIKFIFLKTYV